MLLKLLLLTLSATVCFAGVPKVIGKARPCRFHDYNCIRANFIANSHCNPKTRPVKRHYWIPSHRFETPHFNASYIDKNLVISGLERCFVSEFYYNVNSDTGVLGIDCPNLNFVSRRTLMQHWPLQEDDVYHYSFNGTYPLIRLTTSLDRADKLDICREFTWAFVAALPWFFINPEDLPTEEFLTTDLTMLNIFERETFFYRASMLARAFINSRLCDFGCN